ncbi:MAG: hypothetical protein ACFFAN_12940 [Promethearchaeota archaeon]
MKLLKDLDKYHPNLIANLSKEAYEVHSIKKSIYNDLFKLINGKEITLKKIRKYIENKIIKCKKTLKEAKSDYDINHLKLSIEILEDI